MNAPDPRTHAISPDVLELVPESVVREYCVLPARVDERTITIFCPDDAQFGKEEQERLQYILNRSVAWWPAQREIVQEAIINQLGELGVIVINCDVKFRFRCPRLWEQLRATDNDNIRLCDVCGSSVHRAADANEADRLARQGQCVAYSYSEECDTLGLIEFD